jgi:hypothetical protein
MNLEIGLIKTAPTISVHDGLVALFDYFEQYEAEIVVLNWNLIQSQYAVNTTSMKT